MSTIDTENAEKVIRITQIENPHKFWYKYSNDVTQDRLLEKLESEIGEYAFNCLEEPRPNLQLGDVVVAFHSDWNKWIRGKIKAIKRSKIDEELVKIWAIDYGCIISLPGDRVFILEELDLAYRHPINIHIGGLSKIVPAKFVCFT